MPISEPASPQADATLQRLMVVACAILQILTPMLPMFGIGQPIGSQSDRVQTLITPAGWAFSIWGALYTGSILFAIYQALPAQQHSALLTHLRWPAAGAFMGNAAWAAYTQIFGLSGVSAAIIVFTLTCLLVIFRRLYEWEARFTVGERWLIVLPLTALAGWLTAATIVNIAAALQFHGVEGGASSPLISAGLVIVGGVIVAAALTPAQGNPPYALVFLWALAAIYASGGQESGLVAGATAIAAILTMGAMIAGLRRGGVEQWLRSAQSSAADASARNATIS